MHVCKEFHKIPKKNTCQYVLFCKVAALWPEALLKRGLCHGDLPVIFVNKVKFCFLKIYMNYRSGKPPRPVEVKPY